MTDHHRDLSARQYVEDHLDAAERHMDTHASLQRVAGNLGVPIVKVSDHLGWRQEADRLMAAAETILAERREVWTPSRQYGERQGARGRGTVTVAPRHPGGWRICLRSQDTGTARRTCGCTGECRTSGAREAGLVCALRSLSAGLERTGQNGPAKRRAVILRQGLHGHDPAHPGTDGKPGYPGQSHGHP